MYIHRNNSFCKPKMQAAVLLFLAFASLAMCAQVSPCLHNVTSDFFDHNVTISSGISPILLTLRRHLVHRILRKLVEAEPGVHGPVGEPVREAVRSEWRGLRCHQHAILCDVHPADRDNNIDLKYQFELRAFPTLMVVRAGKYAVYQSPVTENATVLADLIRKAYAGKLVVIPAKKTAADIIIIQTKDNLRGLARMMDAFGLGHLPTKTKAILALAFLLAPIVAVFLYVKVFGKKDDKKTKQS